MAHICLFQYSIQIKSKIILITLSLLTVYSTICFCGTERNNTPTGAMVNDDRVRVRQTPNLNGKYVGVLKVNDAVKISGSTQEKTTVNGESFRWFKIKLGEIEGWVFGKYLDLEPIVSSDEESDYPDNKTKSWLDTKFSTEQYFWEIHSADDFTIEEYDKLIKLTKKHDVTAARALFLSLLIHLKKNPEDPKYKSLIPKF